MEEINFSSPFSNSFSLGTPFLVEYDNTTSLKAIENAGDILDIQVKPDVAVLNKKVRMQGEDKGKAKIGFLDQNLMRRYK